MSKLRGREGEGATLARGSRCSEGRSYASRKRSRAFFLGGTLAKPLAHWPYSPRVCYVVPAGFIASGRKEAWREGQTPAVPSLPFIHDGRSPPGLPDAL